MIRAQRRRKDLSPLDNGHGRASPQPTEHLKRKSLGFFPGFFTAKRRNSQNGHPQAPRSTLPTHHYQLSSSRPSNTCENFLMGGQFYAGKDKARRHMRKKTIWHRHFCATPGRMVLSIFILGYILLWHILVPLTDSLLEYGRELSPNRDSLTPKITQDIEHSLTSIAIEKTKAHRLHEERNKILYGLDNRIMEQIKVFKKIIPEWYTFYHGKDDDESDSRDDATDKDNDNTQEEKRSIIQAQNNISDVDTFGKGPTVERNLQNFDILPSRSSCPSNLSPEDVNTTLVVQCSTERIWILEETCSRWKDPIVAVVYVSDIDESSWKEAADWNVICPQLTIIAKAATTAESDWEYPVNRLRNVALDAVKTSHVLVSDIDFVPSLDLHATVNAALKESNITSDKTHAVVVPAFERIPPGPCETFEECSTYLKSNSSFIPHLFDDLYECVIGKECDIFQRKVNWEGHYSTSSSSWLKSDWYESDVNDRGNSKKMRAIRCFDTFRYEPYVVLRWCPSKSESPARPLAPYYDERFFGYGKNKIEMISHLRYLSYKFSVLPRGFLVHNPHPASSAKKVWNNVKEFDLHKQMDKLYPQFLKELRMKYVSNKTTMIQMCEHIIEEA